MAQLFSDGCERVAQLLSTRRIDIAPATLLSQMSQDRDACEVTTRSWRRHVHSVDRSARYRRVIERFVRTRATVILSAIRQDYDGASFFAALCQVISSAQD